MINIVEYLITKHNQKNAKDIPVMDIEEICKWLDSKGVTEHYKWKKHDYEHVPEVGKLLYEIGACDNRPGTHWVSLTGHTKNRIQTSIVRTKTECTFSYSAKSGNIQNIKIDFDTAIDIMQQMINNPNLDIKL